MEDLDLLDGAYTKERLQALAIPKQKGFLMQFLKVFEEVYKDHPIQAKATLVFQNLLIAKDPLLCDPDLLERLLAAIPNPLALNTPDYIPSDEEEPIQIFEKASPEYLEQLLSTIFLIWKREPTAFLGSFPCHLILFCIDQEIIKNPLEPFLLKLFTIAPEEWLVEYWQGLNSNLQINVRLFTETGKFNPKFEELQIKILRILDQTYRWIFSSELLKYGAEIYCVPVHDEYQGHIIFHEQWEYRSIIPIVNTSDLTQTKESLILRLNEEDDEFTGNILLSENSLDDEKTQIIWDDDFLKDTIYAKFNVVQRYVFLKAYIRNLIQLGIKNVLEIARSTKKKEKPKHTDDKIDYLYNSLLMKDSLKAREFIRGFAFELLSNDYYSGIDINSEILQKIYHFTK